MSPHELWERLSLWIAARPTHTKVLLALATTLVLVELLLKRLAPASRAYAAWSRGIEGLGAVWTAVLLSLIYLLSIGPVALIMRLTGKDLLDRRLRTGHSAWHSHEPNPLGPKAAARHQF